MRTHFTLVVYSAITAAGLWAVIQYTRGLPNGRKDETDESVEAETLPVSAPEKKEKPSLRLHVYFGSQTGTAESFAREIVEEAVVDFAVGCGPNGAESVESISAQQFFSGNDPINLILLLSTYGEGDPSDDAVAFDEYLCAQLEQLDPTDASPLAHVNFAIFGLGNKQYALFNQMAKRTEKNLIALGANRICPTGLGDDNADIEKDFNTCKDHILWTEYLSRCFSIDIVSARENRLVRNPLDKIFLDLKTAPKRGQLPFDATVQSSTGGDVISKFYFASHIVPVVAVTHLCPGKVQVDVDITKVPALKYRTGDTLEVLPVNTESDITWFLGKYNVEDSEAFMTFTKKKCVAKITAKKPFPTPCTLKQAVGRYIDFNCQPTRLFVRDICLLMGRVDPDILAEKVKTRGKSEVITIRSFLESEFPDFNSVVSMGDMVQLLPKQKPRAYSICSSPLVDAKKIQLVMHCGE